MYTLHLSEDAMDFLRQLLASDVAITIKSALKAAQLAQAVESAKPNGRSEINAMRAAVASAKSDAKSPAVAD